MLAAGYIIQIELHLVTSGRIRLVNQSSNQSSQNVIQLEGGFAGISQREPDRSRGIEGIGPVLAQGISRGLAVVGDAVWTAGGYVGGALEFGASGAVEFVEDAALGVIYSTEELMKNTRVCYRKDVWVEDPTCPFLLDPEVGEGTKVTKSRVRKEVTEEDVKNAQVPMKRQELHPLERDFVMGADKYVELMENLKKAKGANHGLMLKGEKPDSRSALTIAPDGKIYTLISVQNTTGFGKGKLHHLCRYDPNKRRHEDLGVLAVKNPDFFDFKPTNGKKPPWSHGYHTLPDGTMTPLHNHMALIATRDNTLYATIIYPFTLLKIDAYRKEPPAAGPAEKYLRSIHQHLDRIEKNLPQFTKLGEMSAERYERGGLVGFHWLGATLEQELIGRSGGLMHIGVDRPWQDKKLRTEAEKAQDLAVVAWDADPKPNDLKRLQQFKEAGQFVLGFGSKRNPRLAEHAHDVQRLVEIPSAGRPIHIVAAVV